MATTSPRTFVRPTKRHLIAIVLAVAVAAGVGATVRPAHAAEAPVNLGTAGSYGVLGGSEVTNDGPTVIGGDLGVNSGTSVTGFPPGVYGGALHNGDAVALQAQNDLTAAYIDAAGRPATTSGMGELGGQNLTPGVYAGDELTLTGALTLTGDADSVWIFQAASSLITSSDSRVLLSGPVNPCNVFWQISSSATLDTGSTMVGTIMALASITALEGASVNGRLLAQNGNVTLLSNTVTGPLSCAVAPPATALPGQATFAG